MIKRVHSATFKVMVILWCIKSSYSPTKFILVIQIIKYGEVGKGSFTYYVITEGKGGFG